MSGGPSRRRILHVDVDAMFVQCAILADPDHLAGEELILVGGDPRGRGVVTSASYGCRRFGVRSAMPMATAARLCPRALIVPVPGAMVRRKSRELAAALDRWSPLTMMASVDEAYLDLTGTEALYRGEKLEDTARAIQRDIEERTRLVVSIGGGTNRLVAKLATGRAKPAGVHIVHSGSEEEFVGTLELADLIGVGPGMLAELRRRGIIDLAGLRVLEPETMAAWWGPERARSLWRACRGIDDRPIEPRPVQRSISSETTFPHDRSVLSELEQALLVQVVEAGANLRRHALFARTISVRLRDAHFRTRSRSRTLPQPVATDHGIYRVARSLLADLRAGESTPIRRIGISLTSLSDVGEAEQGSLLEVAPGMESDRERALARAVDAIRARHGRVIAPGTVSRRRAGDAGGRDGSTREPA